MEDGLDRGSGDLDYGYDEGYEGAVSDSEKANSERTLDALLLILADILTVYQRLL